MTTGGNGSGAGVSDRPRTAGGLGAFGGAIGGAVAGALLIMTADSDLATHPLTNLSRAGLIVAVYAVLGAAIGALLFFIAGKLTRSGQNADASPVRVSAVAGAVAIVAALLAAGMTSEAVSAIWLHTAIVLAAATFLAALWIRSDGSLRTVTAMATGVLSGSMVLVVGLRFALNRLGGGWLGWIVTLLVAGAVGYVAWLISRRITEMLTGRMSDRKAAMTVPAIVGGLLVVLAVAGLVSEIRGFQTWERKLQTVMNADEGATESRPNVILISVDTLRADYVGYAGGDVRTPTLDALAEESYVFERAFAPAPWTRPSFAAFFGGRYPSEMGVGRIRGQLSEGTGGGPVPFVWRGDHQWPVEAMRDAGYFTSAVVVNPQLAASANASRGFDFYYHAEIDYTQPRPAISVSRLLGDALLPSIQLIPEPVELERAPVVTEHAVELIDHTENRPLLLWLHYLDPHDPYDPPTIEPEKRITATATQTRMEARTITRREMYRDAYAREIDYWDSWFKRIVQQLESAGLWENSIVVFWSDHGEEFWEHGDWGHGQTLYNDQVHVPLLIHLPGQTESVQVSQPVSLLDVMPSVLELCDVEHPDDIRGRSLAPVFDGRPEQMPPLHFYLESCSKGAIRKALLQDRYKLIYDLDGDRLSLYDLQEDMAERHDLYGTEHAPDVSHMEEELMEWTELSLAMMAQTAGEAAAEELPPGVRQRLRDMGYIQ